MAAAGGGKALHLSMNPRYCNNRISTRLFYVVQAELRELVHKSQEMYPKAYPGAKWMEKKSQWTFPPVPSLDDIP